MNNPLSEAIAEAAYRAMQEQRAAIEAAARIALQEGHGVRVDEYTDGAWAVQLDRTTSLQITTYRHGHPYRRENSEDQPPAYPCPNCESLADARRG